MELNIMIMIAIVVFSILMLFYTKNRESIDGLIYGLTCFVLQCSLFTGLFLKEVDNISSQMIQVILILSAAVTLATGITLIRRASR